MNDIQVLSARERQIAANLALGQTRKDVSRKLYIAPSTAVTHTKNIYSKTGCHNLADITRLTIAEALGKSLHEIDEAVKKLIDLSSPLKLILMTVFISVQVYIIWIEIDELARVRATKTARAKTQNARKIKDTYYA